MSPLASQRIFLIFGQGTFSIPIIRMLHQAFGPSPKIVHNFTAEHIPHLCPEGKCCVDLSTDVCSITLHWLHDSDVSALLDAAEWIIHFVSDPPTIADALDQSKLLATLRQPAASLKTYTLVTKYKVNGTSDVEQDLWHQALAATQDTPKSTIWVQMADIYGGATAADMVSGARIGFLDRLIWDSLRQPVLADPDDGVPHDLVYVRDAASAWKKVRHLSTPTTPFVLTSGTLTSLRWLKTAVAELHRQCLGRSVDPAVPTSFGIPDSEPPNRRIPYIPRPNSSAAGWVGRTHVKAGIAAVLHAFAFPGESLTAQNAQAQCLHGEAQRRHAALSYYSVAAQMGHPIICDVPKVVHSPGTASKTLVVVVGPMRSFTLTWGAFQSHLLNPKHLGGPVDLALSVSAIPYAVKHSPSKQFFNHASYVWELYDPPRNSFRYYYNEVAAACHGRAFTWKDVSVIGRAYQGNFLVNDKATGPRVSGFSLLWYRWVAMQQMQRLGLLQQYRTIILTRCDNLFIAPHPRVDNLSPGELLIPEHPDDRGLHNVSLYHGHMTLHATDAPTVLSAILQPLIDRPGERVVVDLRSQGMFSGPNWNTEQYFAWWVRTHNLTVKRYPLAQVVVLDATLHRGLDDSGRQKVTVPAVITPKYMNEYFHSYKNRKDVEGVQ